MCLCFLLVLSTIMQCLDKIEDQHCPMCRTPYIDCRGNDQLGAILPERLLLVRMLLPRRISERAPDTEALFEAIYERNDDEKRGGGISFSMLRRLNRIDRGRRFRMIYGRYLSDR